MMSDQLDFNNVFMEDIVKRVFESEAKSFFEETLYAGVMECQAKSRIERVLCYLEQLYPGQRSKILTILEKDIDSLMKAAEKIDSYAT